MLKYSFGSYIASGLSFFKTVSITLVSAAYKEKSALFAVYAAPFEGNQPH